MTNNTNQSLSTATYFESLRGGETDRQSTVNTIYDRQIEPTHWKEARKRVSKIRETPKSNLRPRLWRVRRNLRFQANDWQRTFKRFYISPLSCGLVQTFGLYTNGPGSRRKAINLSFATVDNLGTSWSSAVASGIHGWHFTSFVTHEQNRFAVGPVQWSSLFTTG